MRSSTGQHYAGLDHIRAVAAFLVFTWHFMHGLDGVPVPFNSAPELGLLDEGHAGVALFMTLSGYLFAKLLGGRPFSFPAFLWNRFIRLAPLLAIVFFIGLLSADSYYEYAKVLIKGVVKPIWPNGGWSIAVEMQFYLLLPFLLRLMKYRPSNLFIIMFLAVVFRFGIWFWNGEVQNAAYWSIAGRIDQFTLGILAFECRDKIARQWWAWPLAALGILVAYSFFDAAGGFYKLEGVYPSPSPLWIIWPTLEASCFSVLIACYDARYRSGNSIVLKIAALAGTYSYSIYLLHFFVVFNAARFIDQRVMHIENFYAALPWALLCYLAMIPVGYVSFRLVEEPFLKLRIRYIRRDEAVADIPLQTSTEGETLPPIRA